MTNALQVFSYEGQQIRTVEKNGESWFVGSDVAQALGYVNPQKAIRDHVFSDDKGTERIVHPLGGSQETIIINQPGVYALIFGSKLENAQKFKYWLAHEVLPQIEKTGAYIPDSALMKPEFIRQLSIRLDALQKENEKYRKYIESNMPAMTVGKLFLGNVKAVDAQEASHMLQQQGIDIGMKRLYAHERNKKYLCSREGRQKNRPTHRAIELGLYTYQIGKGGHLVPMIMPKRVAQIYKELLREQYPIFFLIEQDETQEYLKQLN